MITRRGFVKSLGIGLASLGSVGTLNALGAFDSDDGSWKGQIYDVRHWDQALGDEEIIALSQKIPDETSYIYGVNEEHCIGELIELSFGDDKIKTYKIIDSKPSCLTVKEHL